MPAFPKLRSVLYLLLALGLSLGLLPPAYRGAGAPPPPEPASRPLVDAALQQQMDAGQPGAYLIYFREQADLSAAAGLDWQARGRYVMQALQSTARRSQAHVRARLEAQGVPYRAFWIDNVIAVRQSGPAVFNQLLSAPEILALRSERVIHLDETPARPAPASPQGVESNLAHIQADQVWAQGLSGQGVVVANIDTGVRYTHAALRSQYRGALGGGVFNHNYNWWDVSGTFPDAPGDTHGHGSHTMGILVGDDGAGNRIGMAPGARWMACSACGPAGCPTAALLECGEFMLAPWDLQRANPNPDLRPNVVNNSWGDCGRAYDPWYQGVVDHWLAAGIYPVFSAGNASNCLYPMPPGLNTVGNPARYGNVTAVGSSTHDTGAYAQHSNWGPGDQPDPLNPNPYNSLGRALKPQVLAPGVAIRSAVNSGDQDYASWDGTSMSAPHVAGLLALIWQAAPCLVGNYADSETVLEDTAVPIPYPSGGRPAPPPDGRLNYASGHGEINAAAAVRAARGYCGSAVLAGQVTRADSGAPLAGALVEVTNPTSARHTPTDPQGQYRLRLDRGSYTLTVSAYGFQPARLVSLPVSGTLTQSVSLPTAQVYPVSGILRDAATGWPLYAHLEVTIANAANDVGFPGASVWSDPLTGAYSLTLMGGTAYTFEVRPWSDGYPTVLADLGPFAAPVVHDFDLAPDLGACSAPGYRRFYQQNFEQDPGGYTIEGMSSWAWGQPGSGPVLAHSGRRVWATRLGDEYDNYEDGYLTSPALDLSALAGKSIELSWWQWLRSEDNFDYASLEVSRDGGAEWSEVYRASGYVDSDWTQHRVTLEPNYAVRNFRLRFHFTSDYLFTFPGWYIDDIGLGPCAVPQGGLLLGSVTNANSGAPLPGALLDGPGGQPARAAATPQDPRQPEAFYTLFAPAGTHTFSATLGSYPPTRRQLSLPSGAVLWHDFALPAPALAVDPPSISATLLLSTSQPLSLTLTNRGGVTATFRLDEAARQRPPAAPPLGWGQAAPLPGAGRARSAAVTCDGQSYYLFGGWTSDETLTAEAWKYSAAGDTWSALAPLPVALADLQAVCLHDRIYLVGGYDGRVHTHHFLIYDPAHDQWSASTWPKSRSPLLAVVQGRLYALGGDPGPSSETWVYDPGSAAWSGPLAPMPFPTQYGTAVVAQDYIYILGGLSTGLVKRPQRYNPADDTWSLGPELPTGRISPLAAWYGERLYLAGGGGVGDMLWDAYDDAYTLDPATWPEGSWRRLEGGLPGGLQGAFSPVLGAGSVCVNNRLYAVGGSHHSVYTNLQQYLDAGQLCPLQPVSPWLSAVEPLSASLAPGAQQVIRLALDAGQVRAPGVYTASLALHSSDPSQPGRDLLLRLQAAPRLPLAGSDFTFSPANVRTGQPLTFTASISAGSLPVSYAWDFGDGAGAAGQVVTHSFAASATYTVRMTSTHPLPDFQVVSHRLSVRDPLQAGFTGSPLDGPAPLTVTFTNTSSGGYSASLWDFGDGLSSSQPAPTHTYPLPGSYTVTLSLSDPYGSARARQAGYITVRPQQRVYLPLSGGRIE